MATKFVKDQISLERWRGSEEWQAVEKYLREARLEHIAIVCDSGASLEKIRFAQGAIAAIDSFMEIPDVIFTQEVETDGRR